VQVTYEQVTGGGGKIPILRPGETFKSFAHAQPSPTIAQWSDFHLRGIFAGYGLPFEIVLKPELLGGAAYRGVLAILRQRLQQRRNNLVFPKLTRSRFWILSRGIKRGEIPYDPALFRVEWQPKFVDITVDAGRESRERRANVLGGLDTFTSYDAENGNDYLGITLPAREAEMAAQCEAAKRLAEKYPGLGFSAALARIALLTQGASEGNLAAAAAPMQPNPSDA
jgi:capsid protein